jgi:PKD repeat protein
MTRKLVLLFCFVGLISAAARAQAPRQAAPTSDSDFIGYVPDEFIVVFRTNVLDVLVAAYGPDGLPTVTLNSIQALVDQHGIVGFKRQFRNARPRPFGSLQPELRGHYKVKLPPDQSLDVVVQSFESDSAVHHVEKIGVHRMYGEPNDPYFRDSPNPSFNFDQWHYWDTHGIDAESAWDNVVGDPSVVVGILDSGTRYFHIDLGGNSPPWGPDSPFSGGNIFINPNEIPGNDVDDDGNGFEDDTIGWDFVSSAGGGGVKCLDQDCSGVDNDPDDGDGHGTHVSGTVGAITNNNLIVAGVAGGFSDGTTSGVGNGAKILPLRIGYHARYQGQITGIVRMDWAAEAMNYVADLVDAGHNVAAVNCSWGSSNSGGLNAAVDALHSRDVMVVHAAGNSGSSSPDFLGNKAGVMNVAATDINGSGASFSNHGSWVDVAAPGVTVLSTYRDPDDPDPNNHYLAFIDGTSMSAPHICGIAALLESCNPALSRTDKFNLIVNNTQSYSDSRDLGSGIANAQLALVAAGCGIPCDVVADFSADTTSGCQPLSVNFTDLSTGAGISSWSWTFGDGGSSTAQNPSHSYTVAGVYNVNLTATGTNCSDSETKNGYITVSDVPIADFSGSPTAGNTPLNVNFTDLSSGSPTSWSWDFGDSGSSSAQNPSHNYASAGTYTVTLTATNSCGSDVEIKTNYITVTDGGDPTEMFVFDLVVTRQNLGGGNKQGIATVTIYDDGNNPVQGATVTGDFSGKTTDIGVNGVTDANGQVTLLSSIERGGGTWCFDVTNVTHGTLTYNSALNNVTQACE